MGPNTHSVDTNLVAGNQLTREGQGATTQASPGVDGPQKVTFGKDAAGFLTELRRRVDDYFIRIGKSRNDCWPMYIKSVVILAALITSYVLLVFVAQTWQAVPLALLLGVSMALVGFNIQHDGGHHSYSRREWVNKLAAMTLDLIGASSYLWHWKHVVYHHTYVNVHGQDTDIDVSSLLRFTPHAKRLKIQRWQHLYLWPLYGLMASRWRLCGDFKEVVTGTVGPHKIPRPKGWDLVIFLAGKVVSIGLLLVLPMFFHPWWLVLAFYMLVTGVLGVILSVVFQLAHCVEEAKFTMPQGDTLRMEAAWAVHQAEATVDFARQPDPDVAAGRAQLPDRAPPVPEGLPHPLPGDLRDRRADVPGRRGEILGAPDVLDRRRVALPLAEADGATGRRARTARRPQPDDHLLLSQETVSAEDIS